MSKHQRPPPKIKSGLLVKIKNKIKYFYRN